jgi:hypothetical protein
MLVYTVLGFGFGFEIELELGFDLGMKTCIWID